MVRSSYMKEEKQLLFVRTVVLWVSAILMIAFVMPLAKVEGRLDPLRLITGALPPKDAMYIVQDLSGSNAFPLNPYWAIDTYGMQSGYMHYNWIFSDTGTSCGPIDQAEAIIAADYSIVFPGRKPSSGVGQGYWLLARVDADYSYWYWVPYSRMAMVKNLFGPHIRIYEPAVPAPYTDPCNKPYYRFPLAGGPREGAYYDYQAGNWIGWPGSGTEPMPDQAFTSLINPSRYIEESSDTINWGLITFQADSATLVVPINLVNQDTTVQQFNNLMRLVMEGGLNPIGGTPTNLALNRAKWEINETYYANPQAECRYYATVLVTDGPSNTCNPNDAE